MIVERFISGVFCSNMYVLRQEYSRDAIVIDPGEVNSVLLINYFQSLGVIPACVILTHEHFDHCAGVNILDEYFDFHLLVSSGCAEKIKSDKGNLSRYAGAICDPFEIRREVTVMPDSSSLEVCGVSLNCIATPGHSVGGTCVLVDNCLFSGDTLLETKVPVKLPGGDIHVLQDSLQKLYLSCDSSFIVYPGHGDCFPFK